MLQSHKMGSDRQNFQDFIRFLKKMFLWLQMSTVAVRHRGMTKFFLTKIKKPVSLSET